MIANALTIAAVLLVLPAAFGPITGAGATFRGRFAIASAASSSLSILVRLLA